MSTIGVSTVVIITIISALIIVAVSLGIWSIIQHKHRQQRSSTTNSDEEHQMTLIPNAAAVAGAVPAPPKPGNKPPPFSSSSQTQEQDNNLETPRFSFDKNSVDGLEEIDLAMPEGHQDNLGKEQEDPLIKRPGRVMSRLPAWV